MPQRLLAWLKDHWEPVALLALGLLTRFIGLGSPSYVVWDEQHFCKFAAGYLDGSYFFDIHPPLGKFLIYLPLKLAGAQAPEDFQFPSGTAYPAGYPYLIGRLMPALFGALMPLLVWLVARTLGLSRKACIVAGGFLLLENAFIVESRFTLIDIFLHFFIFAAVLAFLLHRKAPVQGWTWWSLLATAGLFCGCAASVKWTGIGVIGVLGLVAAMDWLDHRRIPALAAQAALLTLLPFAVYATFMWFHFSLLTNTGPGNAFMTPRFRAGLAGSDESLDARDHAPMSFAEKFRELGKEMYRANHDNKMTHGESSRYYEWPVMRKPIWFWVDRDEGNKDGKRRIFLLGNPVAWAFGGSAMLLGLGFVFWRGRVVSRLAAERPEWRERVFALQFLFLVYAAYYLPFIGIERPMFLYHYFTAFIASLLLGALIYIDIMPLVGWSGEPPMTELDRTWVGTLLGVALLAFIIYSPVTYGYRPAFDAWSSLMPLNNLPK